MDQQMEYQNKYEDNETVKIRVTGEIVTVEEWGYVRRQNRYTYVIKERPSTFYFEEELAAIE